MSENSRRKTDAPRTSTAARSGRTDRSTATPRTRADTKTRPATKRNLYHRDNNRRGPTRCATAASRADFGAQPCDGYRCTNGIIRC